MVHPPFIRLFPLPNVVLFPGMALSLHIFEPRYRQMVADALEGDRMIGMTLLQEGWEEEERGCPPIYSIGCLGRIAQEQRLDDGRFNILLEGVCTFEIREEIGGRPYREAWVRYRNAMRPSPLPPDLLTELERATTFHAQKLRIGENLLASLRDTTEEERVQALCFLPPFTVLEKQFLLESADLSQQCKRLLDLIHLYTLTLIQTEEEGHA